MKVEDGVGPHIACDRSPGKAATRDEAVRLPAGTCSIIAVRRLQVQVACHRRSSNDILLLRIEQLCSWGSYVDGHGIGLVLVHDYFDFPL